jgi:nucleotide-binding universal stress UspA family protein/predicted transcriptional regulator
MNTSTEKKKILVPVDLSQNSLGVLDMATTLAEKKNASITFLYVEPTLHSPDGGFTSDLGRGEQLKRCREQQKLLRPCSDEIEFEHLVITGNPGPKIVSATANAEICVMSTHGRSGIQRLLMGSVAEYVLRHAKCPVVLVKGFGVAEKEDPESQYNAGFVTEVMHQVAPVHKGDRMNAVLKMLKKAGESGAPVVDCDNRCIGILTTTDIEIYHELQHRYQAGDRSVIEEMFETDDYGLYICENESFDTVERHMTEEVVSVRNDDGIPAARELFEANPDIHHLVVLDEDGHPVGIVDSDNLPVAPPAIEEAK